MLEVRKISENSFLARVISREGEPLVEVKKDTVSEALGFLSNLAAVLNEAYSVEGVRIV